MRSIRRANLIASHFLLALATVVVPARAQRELSGAARDKLSLAQLQNTGSVLMIAAHPDDENTALLAYFARGRHLRTGYLSLTRGEGGQNLIGSEQGDALGIIRTQELLAARKIDGAEQFFTRAIDFGFTKTPVECFQKWGRDRILSDIVWVIRRFEPDVIVLRFSGTPRDGHGQHQASAILSKEAFTAAADPTRFPEQLQWVHPWQTKRLFWNAFSFTKEQEAEVAKMPGRLEVDLGEYDPVLGHSYAEIAGMSRSMHRSQGMGAPERHGSQKNYLVLVAGEPAKSDAFDGIDVSWKRVPGGPPVGELLSEAARTFNPDQPDKTVPLLLKAQPLMAGIHHQVAERKQVELNEAIALCSGLWTDSTADQYAVIHGGNFGVTATALRREAREVTLRAVSIETAKAEPAGTANASAGPLPLNEPKTVNFTVKVALHVMDSQPYWLREPKEGETYTVADQQLIGMPENPPLYQAHFQFGYGAQTVELVRPVVYDYIDHVLGERTRPVIVAPPLSVAPPELAMVFPDGDTKSVEVQVRANAPEQHGELTLRLPTGWRVEPASAPFHLRGAGDQSVIAFQVTPPAADSIGELRAVANENGQMVDQAMQVIEHEHIPPQTVFPLAATKMVRATIHLNARRIGYVMGAGDTVPEALRQLNAEISLLTGDDLARADLSRFDAIVTGVRAYNTRPDLRANEQRLLDYVQKGGTLVVQYNVAEGLNRILPGNPKILQHIGPYPLTIGGDRVTVEEQPVRFPDPASPLLQAPNRITDQDFNGWVQERGLYFASEWDPRYHPLFETHDPGEKPLSGGTLYATYGKGAYVFTAFSWFRELPAGVPGAYRVFANLLSAGTTLGKAAQPPVAVDAAK